MYNHDTTVYHNRFAAFGWHTVTVDGHDISSDCCRTRSSAERERSTDDDRRPNLERERRLFLEDREGWHGKPLKKGEELEKALSELPLNGSGGTVK